MKTFPEKKLRQALNLGQRELISIIGGGGKSSLLFSLARELLEDGCKVISTTTTKVRYEEALQAPYLIVESIASEFTREVECSVLREGHIFVGKSILSIGKVDGIAPELADAFFREMPIDFLITEADGAAGLPLKAHAGHEPVIPSASTIVIAVAGLEVLGRPFGPETVFRQEIFEAVTGAKSGEPLSVELVAAIFRKREGLFRDAPLPARKVAFLNKIDLLENKMEAEKLAEILLTDRRAGIERVVIGSLQEGVYTVYMKMKNPE
jgi:probable selenium-dependent hydroxylase accessory protein YqeC